MIRIMLRLIATAITLSVLAIPSFAQGVMPTVLNYIQTKSDIREGGSDLFEYDGVTYLITVSQVAVSTSRGSKTEQQCKTVGSAKAKRDMLTYINGSDITSSTRLCNSEVVTDGLNGTKVECKQEYVEEIRERVVGTIAQVNPLGGWYSEDKSVYYYAIYKIIQ